MTELYTPPEARELGGADKFRMILELFGSAKAREAFIDLCRQYHTMRGVGDMHDNENFVPGRTKSYSPPKRAFLHNRIMDTLQRLSMGKMDNQHRTVLNEMSSREVVAKTLKEYFLSQGEWSEEDLEEDESKRLSRLSSDVARFHSMGGEDRY